MAAAFQQLQMRLQPWLVAGGNPVVLACRRGVQRQVQGGCVVEQLFFQQTFKHGAHARLLAAALHVQTRRQGDAVPGKAADRDDGSDLIRAARGGQQSRAGLAAALSALTIVADDVEIFCGGVCEFRWQLY